MLDERIDSFLILLHIPVMGQEILEILAPRVDKIYVDGTFGAGGHSRLLLNSAPCVVHAFDRDFTAIEHAKTLGNDFVNFNFYNNKFSSMDVILKDHGVHCVDGILLDVGVSSMQIDQGERGFSFQNDGPLLMTMGCNEKTAFDVVNGYSEEDLIRLIIEYGEEKERDAAKIAAAICINRKKEQIQSTGKLARIILDAKGGVRTSKIHPATLTFQAIRIEVNNELREIEAGIIAGSQMLAEGGVMAIITFQALETRLVKLMFRDLEKSGRFMKLSSTPWKPSRAEVKNNARARSAIMRAIRKV